MNITRAGSLPSNKGKYGEESISVGVEEIDALEWADKVYRPDIVSKADTLYKKPGYTM